MIELDRDPNYVWEAYSKVLQDCVRPFLNQITSQAVIEQMRQSIIMAQDRFLSYNADYVAARPVCVSDLGHGEFNVYAPICTIVEKRQMEWEAREAERVAQEFIKKAEVAEAKYKRQHANMERQLRRLLRRYDTKIPSATSSIWDTLTLGQQYAILKDIDYNVRHAVTGSK
jgi:hypothetical protein